MPRAEIHHPDQPWWPDAGLAKRDAVGHGMTIACAYSVRPRAGAPVAAPLAWDELDGALDPLALSLRTVPGRVARLGDLHAPLLSVKQRLRAPARR